MACFTLPKLKVERVSYEVITPSAARGVLEAVLWKPAIRWSQLRRNEVNGKLSERGDFTTYCADEDGAR